MLGTITSREPRRSISRASSGPVPPTPIAKAPATSPALPKEPVSPWMKRTRPTAPIPTGRRARMLASSRALIRGAAKTPRYAAKPCECSAVVSPMRPASQRTGSTRR